jgi:hypothetical protein
MWLEIMFRERAFLTQQKTLGSIKGNESLKQAG